MEFAERKVQLKDGRAAILRAPRIEDAAALIEYLRTIAGETPFLVKYPDEIQLTLEQEQDYLRGRIDDPRGAMILATVDGEHAGNSSFMGVGGGRRWAHRCTLGVALYQEYCGLGLGRKLLEYALELAKGCGYEQAEMEVVDGNARAIALYESLGFESCGCRPRDMKYDDGTYADMRIMTRGL